MEITIDVEHLRSDLIDYFGTGACVGNPAMMAEVWDIEKASDREVVRIAQQEGFDLYNYEL